MLLTYVYVCIMCCHGLYGLAPNIKQCLSVMLIDPMLSDFLNLTHHCQSLVESRCYTQSALILAYRYILIVHGILYFQAMSSGYIKTSLEPELAMFQRTPIPIKYV